MASETTAAATGRVGVVRRDPMAMRPFCGYNMADYFTHWLEMGEGSPAFPKIFHVNWFRRSAEGKLLWPGFGENMRVLRWIHGRVHGRARAEESPIGLLPPQEAIDTSGLALPPDAMRELLDVDRGVWLEEAADQEKFLAEFGPRLPPEIRRQHADLVRRLKG